MWLGAGAAHQSRIEGRRPASIWARANRIAAVAERFSDIGRGQTSVRELCHGGQETLPQAAWSRHGVGGPDRLRDQLADLDWRSSCQRHGRRRSLGVHRQPSVLVQLWRAVVGEPAAAVAGDEASTQCRARARRRRGHLASAVRTSFRCRLQSWSTKHSVPSNGQCPSPTLHRIPRGG